MRIKILLLFLVFQFHSFAQSTYVWVGANYADFGTATNWSPSRDTARVTDILHFRNNVGSDTLLITNYGWGVNSQSNAGQMWVESGKNIVFLGQTFPNQLYGSLLTLFGGDGPVLVVDSNAHFGLYTPEISFFTFNPRTIDINPSLLSDVLINGVMSMKSTSSISPGNIYFKNCLINLQGDLNLLSNTQFTNGNFQGVFIANQPGYVYFGNPNYNSKLKVFGRLNYIGGGDQFVNACDSCIEYHAGSKVNVNYSGNLSRNNFTGHFFEGSEINVLSLPANQNHTIQLPDSISHLKINYANPNALLQITSASTQYNYLRRDVLIKGNVQVVQTGNSFVQFNLEDNFDTYIQGNITLDGGKIRLINHGLTYEDTKSRLFLNGNYYQNGGEIFFGGIAQRFGIFSVKGHFFSNNGFIKNPGTSLHSFIEFNGTNTQTLNFFNQVDDSLRFVFNNGSGFVLVNNLNIGHQAAAEIYKGSFSGNGRLDFSGNSTLVFKNSNLVYQTNNKIWSSFSSPANLTIAGAGGILLHSSKTVTNVCDLQKGKIFLNASDTLYIGNSTAGSGSILFNNNAYVVGKLSRWIGSGLGLYHFPIGSNTADRRMSIDFTGSNLNSAYVTAEFVNSQPGILGLPLTQSGITVNKTGTEGFWRMKPATGFNFGAFTIRVLAKQFGGIQNVSNLVLLRREQSGSPFQLAGSHILSSGSSDSVVLGRTGIMLFGDYAVGGDMSQNPLPVSLLHFNGIYLNETKSAELNWVSTSEINLSEYIIERSIDGLNWAIVGNVKAIGNSSINVHYHFSDLIQLENESIYYRLKMLDEDGKFDYSKIITLNNETDFQFKVFPNPNSGGIVETNVTTNIKITDLMGRLFYEGFANKIDVSNWSKGVYLINTIYGSQRLVLRD